MPDSTSALPRIAGLYAPAAPPTRRLVDRFEIATYNVHRWAGVRGGNAYHPKRAQTVIEEIGADVLALQEVLRPADADNDPLQEIARALGLHLAFVETREHRQGALGNAVLSRWPLSGVRAIDLTFGRLEQRAALAVQIQGTRATVTVAATHLALVDRTRSRQVRALLNHPDLVDGPVVLLGDMNAWRPGKAARQLDEAFTMAHHNRRWPPSYPSVRPVLALDRAYARGLRLERLRAHDSDAARRASDHLPVRATAVLEECLTS